MVLAASLSSLAGFVDAVGFIAVGGYFVSFMSGNTTQAAVAIADGAWHDLLVAGSLIVAFVVGVVGGSLAASVRGIRRRPVVLALVTALLVIAAGAHAASAPVVLCALVVAAAMGAENATFERDGEVSIGLTYMTGTLVKLGQSLARVVRGDRDRAWLRYAVLWSGLAGGAVLGALVYRGLGFASVWVAAGGAALATLVTYARDL